MNSGIYTIENLVNGKLYVGYTSNFKKRWKEHRAAFEKQQHENNKLQAAWNKYGEDNFLFEVLEQCEEQFLCSQEHYWATLLNVHNDKCGYNIRPTHPYGRSKASEESKKRMSAAQKIAMNKPERIEQNRKRMIGKQYGLGHVITEEHRIKINQAHLKRRKVKPPKRSKEELSKLIIERNKGNKYGLGRKKTEEENKKRLATIRKKVEEGWVSPLKGKKRDESVVIKMKDTKSKKSYKGINTGIIRDNLRKAIISYNIDGTLYSNFTSIKEALIHFGKKPDSTSHLTRALKDSNKIVYNKKWSYANTDNR